ncbi:MAG: PAS domain S-box protein, partial [Holophagaceae bacterium]|nr:PAS domain S-box protein [Holophagaceae bacterium]
LYSDLKKSVAGMDELTRDNVNIRKYLESLIQSLGVAIISFDKNGIILTCNKAAESIIGMAGSEILKHNIRHLLPPGAQDEITHTTNYLLQGFPVGDISCVIWNQRGTGTSVNMTIAPILDENNNIVAFSLLLIKATS